MARSLHWDEILITLIAYAGGLAILCGAFWMIFSLSQDSTLSYEHIVVFVSGMCIFFWGMIRGPRNHWIVHLIPLVIALALHLYIMHSDPNLEKYFHYKSLEVMSQRLHIGFLIVPYLFIGGFGLIVVPIYTLKSTRRRIEKNGVDAIAFIESAKDGGARLTEGVHKQYQMKLTLRVMGHPKSPYLVSDKFWVSEFYIHRMSGDEAIPIKVDVNNHKSISLNF